VANCGGIDTIIRQIDVLAPSTAPVVGFYANRVKVPVLTTVTLFDSSFQGGTAWKWKITPSVTTNIIGPDNQQQLHVSFIKSGKYTVQLKVTNSIGADSLIKVDYIEVFDYCAPVVGNTSSDVAISRVVIGSGIDNYSSVGANKYSNYLNDFTAEVLSLRDSLQVTVERQSSIDPMNRKVWVDWNNDGDFDDAQEEVASESSTYNKVFTASVAVPNTATLGYTTLRVGVSYDQDPNRPCGINQTGEFEDYPVRIVVDKTKPSITLLGIDTVWTEVGYLYSDAGATAFDNIDGNLTHAIITSNNVDTSVAGTYYVRYNVSDLDGNNADEVVRTVIINPDATVPVITMNGAATVNLTVGTAYTDAGATAEDYFQVDLTPVMTFGDNLDINLLGTYYYWYVVEDAAGNRDSVVRTINVIDDIDPLLTLNGSNPLIVEVKTAINDPGYASSDNYYGSVFVVVDSSLVQINQLGTYPMTYRAIDGSGNETTLTRIVIVQDNTPAVLNLIGNDTVYVDVFSSYTEQGVQLQDNYCNGLNWEVDQQPNTSVLGDYLLTYTATDCNNNASPGLTRLVRVVDRKAPVLELNGFAANTVYRWQGYNDPGVSITDNYYSETLLQDSVKITTNFDANWVGFYSICYTVTDPSGNKSATVCRTVRVLESISSVEMPEDNRYSIYPNPSQGRFVLSFGEPLTENTNIQVFDMAGKLVHEAAVSQGIRETELNLNIAPGVYQVAVSNSGYQQVLKIQIAH
jgi:PKD repeat protein